MDTRTGPWRYLTGCAACRWATTLPLSQTCSPTQQVRAQNSTQSSQQVVQGGNQVLPAEHAAKCQLGLLEHDLT